MKYVIGGTSPRLANCVLYLDSLTFLIRDDVKHILLLIHHQSYNFSITSGKALIVNSPKIEILCTLYLLSLKRLRIN